MADVTLLEDAGVPIGGPRPAGRQPDGSALRAVLDELAHGPVPAELREPLLAWLSAYRHHWPDEFAELTGESGKTLLRVLEVEPIDDNRYLKLRRIAIANLAAARLEAGGAHRSGVTRT